MRCGCWPPGSGSISSCESLPGRAQSPEWAGAWKWPSQPISAASWSGSRSLTRCCCFATARLELLALRSQLGLEQAVEVHDDIFHFGIIDGSLGVAAPRIE